MESTPSSSPTVHQPQQPVGNHSSTPVATMTPEQEQEIKLRSKYPNPQKPGSNFIQKMLHKGNRKYFDSGDYNMARSRCKANGNKIQTTTINQQQQQQSQETGSSNSSMFDSPSSTCDKLASPVTNLSGDQIQLTVNSCPVNSSPMTTVTSAATTTTAALASSTTNSTGLTTTNSQNLVPNGQYPSSPSVNCTNSYTSLSSSVSTGSLMSQSLSQDKLCNIHLNTSLNNVILDSEEIGHGIPTPECIQSRKHSIAQSKLATPRLSTS